MSLKGNIYSGLTTFEVAAKFGSFTQAANYLHVTTGAVSQQIRILESQLSICLFERHSRGIKLTSAGQKIYLLVQKNFSDIEKLIAELKQDQTPDGEIRLKLTPSFAFKWLVPRLQKFYSLYPNISVHTFAEGALVDHQDYNFDLAIDYGRSPYPYHNAELLLEEQLIPVMSPAYLDKHNWSESLGTNQHKFWQSVILLHDAMPWRDANKAFEWGYWFEQMKITAERKQGHFFNRTDMAMAAAEAGLGVALARYALVTEDFKQGRLVSPFKPIKANAGYYLIQHHSSSAIELFKQWLLAETSKCNDLTG